ncbi:MAG: YifB family Mg chelatase-like AAA ATPase [marine benthic group bacterium]|nr:YifB family Mg chelatase-like AAA ATPase [Gemmatimonadota bacterium]
MFRIVHTFALVGATPVRVRVEVTIRRGAPGIRASGLPLSSARQAVERIRAVAAANALRIPGLRITVNFAPADLHKTGASLDLPLLIGILAGSGLVPADPLTRTAFVGELGLDGSIGAVPGVLPIALSLRAVADLSLLIVPASNLGEVSGVRGCSVSGAHHVSEVLAFLAGETTLPTPGAPPAREPEPVFELADVRGQEEGKRALEVAAAGGHNLLLTGEPGAGKSMLAERLPGILPPLDPEESLELSSLHSISGLLGAGAPLISRRPFRSPHHSVTMSGMIGGGSQPRPGEASLAHRGVLFLDELAEFRATVLESLRSPIENGVVNIVRSGRSVTFPARFQLIAAMNPCPCGLHGSGSERCTCEPWMVRRYLARISGPLMDRFDLRVSLPAVDWEVYRDSAPPESNTAACLARVRRARDVASDRARKAWPQADPPVRCNSELSPAQLRRCCRLDAAGESVLGRSVRRFRLSARGCDRVLSVARTIADLEGCDLVRSGHVAEALHFRMGGL